MPMGSTYVKNELGKMNYYNFFGPHGSGKTLAIRAIANELDAMVVDISPANLEGKISDKDKDSYNKILYMAFTCAKIY